MTVFITFLLTRPVLSKETKNSDLIEIGVLDYPPYYIVKDMDKISGCLADLLNAVATEAQLNYHMVGYPSSRLYNNLANGDTQLWFGTKGVPAYDNKVLYNKESLVNLQLGLYRLKETPEITKKEDLAGKSVLVILGFAYSGFIDFLKDPKNKVQLQSNTTHSGALMMLLNKRGDYLLDYTQTIEGFLKTRGSKNVETTILTSVPLFFVVSKAYPKAQELMSKIESAIESLKKKDELKLHISCSKYAL
jgi:polar amino acid transport system substrate-binding protein